MTFALATQHPSAYTPDLLGVYARSVYEGGDPDDAAFKACYVQYLQATDKFAGDYLRRCAASATMAACSYWDRSEPPTCTA